MKSKDIAFQIGQLLFYTHEDKSMNDEEIEDAIKEIAGEDNRTLTKYKNLLIKYQHIKHLESGRYQANEPEKPLTPSQLVAEARRRYEERRKQ